MSLSQRTWNKDDQEFQTSVKTLCFSSFSNALKNAAKSDDKTFDVKKILNIQSSDIKAKADLFINKDHLFFKLNQINISGCRLTQIPNVIFDFKYLTILNLSNNFLEILPKELGYLCNLIALILSGNKLSCLPKSIKKIQQLNYLDLSSNKFYKVPDVLYYCLRFLKVLDLSCNEISEFNEPLGCLTKLVVLKLSDNFLEKLPIWIFDNLCGLQYFDISQNKLHLDSELSFYHNSGIFESLETLNFYNCNLRYNNIWIIPFFKNLRVLYLGNKKGGNNKVKSNNFLGNIKIEAFKNSKKIKELYLQNAYIATLPKDFNCFINIEILDLSDNLLSWLPECICELVSLKILNLSANQLLFLPPGFGNLVNLKQIHLNSNKLSDIPESFYNLANLEFIDLYNNQIEKVNESFLTKKNLKGIDLELNCLQFSFCGTSIDVDEIKMLYKCLKDCFRKQFCYSSSRYDLQVTKVDKGLSEISEENYSSSTTHSCSSYKSEPSSDLEDSLVNATEQNCHENEDWEKRDSDQSEDECFDPNKVGVFKKANYSWNVDFQSNFCPADYHVPSVMKAYIRSFKLASKNEAVEEGQFDSD